MRVDGRGDAPLRVLVGDDAGGGQTPLFVGGPKDGETTTFLGTIRTLPELATSHFPGYRLHHSGDDPLSGWEMRLISEDNPAE